MAESTSASPTIFLDYGTDAAQCNDRSFQICERGMRFEARWQFAVGTEYGVVLSYLDANGGRKQVRAEATVVGCIPAGPKCREVTMLFTNLPDELRTAIHDVSSRLEVRIPGDQSGSRQRSESGA